MTNDTKAPLPDASHDAYVRLMAAARRSEPHNGYGEADIVSDELTLRAHIAALKVKYHNAVMDLCEVKEVSEQLNDKVTALEAENNRLRSLIERSVNFVSLYAETQKAGKFLEELKSALAQTGEKS